MNPSAAPLTSNYQRDTVHKQGARVTRRNTSGRQETEEAGLETTQMRLRIVLAEG